MSKIKQTYLLMYERIFLSLPPKDAKFTVGNGFFPFSSSFLHFQFSHAGVLHGFGEEEAGKKVSSSPLRLRGGKGGGGGGGGKRHIGGLALG